MLLLLGPRREIEISSLMSSAWMSNILGQREREGEREREICSYTFVLVPAVAFAGVVLLVGVIPPLRNSSNNGPPIGCL